MYRLHCLPLALTALIAGCASTNLNDTLPNLTLAEVLPSVTDNEYCKQEMDSDILYGVGMTLFNNDDYANAKSCLVYAAPEHTRSFCYLSLIADQDEEKTQPERERESFHYVAYAASQNDWCAEYGMYRIYNGGNKGQERDEALATRWLERSALHGYGESQQSLAYRYKSNEDLVASYAWFRILGEGNDHGQLDVLRKQMSAKQLAEGDKRYEALAARVTSKEDMRAEAREEDIGRYSATIHLDVPQVFEGMSTEQRREFIRETLAVALENEQIETRGQVALYMTMTRSARLKGATGDVLDNPQLLAILQDEDLSLSEAQAQAQGVIDAAYP